MQLKAAIANTIWSASSLPAYAHFCHELRGPAVTQRRKLRSLLVANANTSFGKAHRFESIGGYDEFARRVPLSDYSALEPWVERIRKGEPNVLTRDAVTHLVPTSGSTGARKLIPFTSGLQHEFNAAIAPWLADLMRQFPSLIGGPAYWSISPALGGPAVESSVVPIGFDADTAYIGGTRRKLADAIMAVPSVVGRAKSLETFRYQTLFHLLLCRQLRLISVWHPSFLVLLLDALPSHWEQLLRDVERGTAATPPRPHRARELRDADPQRSETLWPELRVVSCWGDAAAGLPLEELRRRFPNAFLQPKGLIATEAFVSLPFAAHHPLAICSHFFEFVDDSGKLHCVETLRENAEYEMVVTTAGGLWRYRLGDRVSVTGLLGKVPSLKFLGRGQSVSDRFGEKLSEVFVAETLRNVFCVDAPRFALLAPDEDEKGCRYTLYIEGNVKSNWLPAIEDELRRNPHYAYCRDLQQLLPLRIFVIRHQGYETFARHQLSDGARLGEIKPLALSRDSGWSQLFLGDYFTI